MDIEYLDQRDDRERHRKRTVREVAEWGWHSQLNRFPLPKRMHSS